MDADLAKLQSEIMVVAAKNNWAAYRKRVSVRFWPGCTWCGVAVMMFGWLMLL